MNEDVWWYATRAAGLMTWATACGSVLIGLFLSLKSVKSRTGPWFFDLHRFLSSISVIFLTTHLGTLFMHDSDVFTWKALLIPGESSWETTAASMGVIALWSLLAVEITSLLRRRISNAIWRVAHALSLVTVAAGTYHAWLGGSDVRNPTTWSIAGLGSLLVVALVAMRLQRKDDVPAGHLRRSDHEELLEEMRIRLEGLPVPEKVSQPELELDSAIALPRRAPLSAADDDPLLADDGPVPPDSMFGEPFATEPVNDPKPDLDGWVGGSPVDAMTDTTDLDPFQRANQIADNETPAPSNPFGGPEPTTDPDPWGGQPFEDSPFGASPFEQTPFPDHSSFGDSNPFADTAPPVLPANLGPASFSSETTPLATPASDELPPPEQGSNPFASPEPTVSAFTAPIESTPDPAAAPAPAMAAAAAPVPPPLPNANGEVDEAAYTAWLVEWLAFAEKYGDEAPEDPSRI